MIPLALILAAAPVDHLYLYGHPNRSMLCDSLRLYVDTEGFGSLRARGCRLHSVDWQWWPDFPLLDIRIDVGVDKMRQPIIASCSFVSHAHEAQASSTVIDCR